jgi:hypothetical protein
MLCRKWAIQTQAISVAVSLSSYVALAVKAARVR